MAIQVGDWVVCSCEKAHFGFVVEMRRASAVVHWKNTPSDYPAVGEMGLPCLRLMVPMPRDPGFKREWR